MTLPPGHKLVWTMGNNCYQPDFPLGNLESEPGGSPLVSQCDWICNMSPEMLGHPSFMWTEGQRECVQWKRKTEQICWEWLGWEQDGENIWWLRIPVPILSGWQVPAGTLIMNNAFGYLEKTKNNANQKDTHLTPQIIWSRSKGELIQKLVWKTNRYLNHSSCENGGSDFVSSFLEVKIKGRYSYLCHSQFRKWGNHTFFCRVKLC